MFVTSGVCSSDKNPPIYFFRLSKLWSISHHGSVGRGHKKCYLMRSLFFIIKFVFLSFSFLFFWWSIKFSQQNINQSETRIGSFQLSVEMHTRPFPKRAQNFNIQSYDFREINVSHRQKYLYFSALNPTVTAICNVTSYIKLPTYVRTSCLNV